MMTIYKYELRKILFKKFSLIAILCTLAVIGLNFSQFVAGNYWIREDGTTIYGIAAAKEMKKAKSEWNGLLDEAKLTQVLKTNQSIFSNPDYHSEFASLTDEGYHLTQGYEDIQFLLITSFEDTQNDDYFSINSLTPEDTTRFYENRITNLEKWLDLDSVKEIYSEQERTYLLDQYKELETPLVYEEHIGYFEVLRAFDYIILFTSMLTAILLAPVFSNEKKTGADAIFLSSYRGRSTGIWSKLGAGFTVVTVLYFSIVLIIDGLFFLLFGNSGGQTMIQTASTYFESMFPITFQNAYIRLLLLGYLMCLLVAALTLFLSAKIKSSFGTIIMIFILLICPYLIGRTNITNITLLKALSYLPHQMLEGRKILQQFQIYTVGKKIWNVFQMMPAIYIPVTLLLFPAAFINFRKVER